MSVMERSVILERLRERIVRYAACKLREGLAEDVAQEVLLVLHEKYAALDRAEALKRVALCASGHASPRHHRSHSTSRP